MREEFCARITEIMTALRDHLGRKVLMIVRDGRAKTALLATLKEECGKICAQYKNYAKDGALIAVRSMYVNPSHVHTGDLTIDYLDDGV